MSFAAQRVPPNNNDAEMSVLGAVMLENDSINKALETLAPDDFYRANHRYIFAAMTALNSRGEPVDLVTLTAELTKLGRLPDVGGSEYLARLVDFVPTAANVEYYARLVKEHSIARRIITVTTDAQTKAYEGREAPQAVLNSVQSDLFKLAEQGRTGGLIAVKGVLKGVFDHINLLYERQELVTGVPTGFEELDRMTSGLQAGDLVIVAGRPSMGKTALVMDIVKAASIFNKKQVPTAVFSLEMSKESLVQRQLCSVGSVDASRLRTGQLEATDWTKLTTAAGQLGSAPIFIDDTPGIALGELRARARHLKAEHDLGLIAIDYLQLMSGSGGDNRQQEISEISRGLKALAKELKVPVIALSQLNRSLENRTDKRPVMADLRESGAIEQDADLIMFVYREVVYCEACKAKQPCDKNHARKAEVIIGKQRNGPIGMVPLDFEGRYTRFGNPAVGGAAVS